MTPDKFNMNNKWIFPRPYRAKTFRLHNHPDGPIKYSEEAMPADQWTEMIDNLLNGERATFAIGDNANED